MVERKIEMTHFPTKIIVYQIEAKDDQSTVLLINVMNVLSMHD